MNVGKEIMMNFAFLSCCAKAKYQISRDEQKLRVDDEIRRMENVDLDDEAKLKE